MLAIIFAKFILRQKTVTDFLITPEKIKFVFIAFFGYFLKAKDLV
jgi:hypothetical protein